MNKMFIQSLLVSTALIQSVIPSGYHSIDPLKVVQHEIQQKFGISTTDPHFPAIQNFQQEIIDQQATFTQEMPFLGALTIETALDPQQIQQAMLPLINQNQGTEIGQILKKVLEPNNVAMALPVSFEEAIVFSMLFESVFPGYLTDLYQVVMKEQTPNEILPILCKTSATNPGKNARGNIKLFSQMNGLWRAIIPNTIVPQIYQQPNGRLHIEYKYTGNVKGDKSVSSANPNPAKKPQKDDKIQTNAKGSKSAENGKPHKADNKDKSASSANPSGKQGNPSKDAKVDKVGAGSKGAKGAKSDKNGKPDKDDKSGKGGEGVSDKKKNGKRWIIGGIIAALVIIPAACFGIYKALNTKRSSASNQDQSGQGSQDSNV